jgi:hypothetical protein
MIHVQCVKCTHVSTDKTQVQKTTGPEGSSAGYNINTYRSEAVSEMK